MNKKLYMQNRGMNYIEYTDATTELPHPVGMGVEVELEETTLTSKLPERLWLYWQLTNDNSLRNNGVEIRHTTPVSGQHLLDSIDILFDMISHLHTPPVISHRCSLHAHIDFRTNTQEEIYAFVHTFILLESLLFTLSNKERYSNIYCAGFTHKPELLSYLGLHQNFDQITKIARIWPKYSGLNLAPLSRQGSIEVRCHSGSLVKENVIKWLQTLNYLYGFALNKTPQDIHKYTALPATRLLEDVFPQEIRQHFNKDNLERYWDNSVRNLYHIKIVEHLLHDVSEETADPTKLAWEIFKCVD